MLVNGEHRIGVYDCAYARHFHIISKMKLNNQNVHFFLTATKILEGEELFINYGPNFFPTSPDTKEKRRSPNPLYHLVYNTLKLPRTQAQVI